MLLLIVGGGGVGVGFGLAIVFDLPWGWLLVAGSAIALIPGFILFVRLEQRATPQTLPVKVAAARGFTSAAPRTSAETSHRAMARG